ncbi:expressed unknown protein [Seminavis robusta]|uniref:Uncharacterized protein n=1 Tax=Seminavis robusta TaxID=568900 RepID=A0A9N8D8Q8_9STRA|nr:expressed unknown protein [Seminavis robusta]|eukprot:Sro3_g002650.1 n/a (191) ;mRNA; r:211192-211764
MKLHPLFFAAFALVQTASASSCPCFSASDVTGVVHSFADGASSSSNLGFSTTFRLVFSDRRSYTVRDSTTTFNFQETQAYTCEVTTLREDFSVVIDPNRIFRVINQAQYFTCRDLLRFTKPTSEAELEAFENQVASASVVLQNAGTGRFLTVAGDGSIVKPSGPFYQRTALRFRTEPPKIQHELVLLWLV